MSTTCPKCHTDNPDDSKFCKECATPLFAPSKKKILAKVLSGVLIVILFVFVPAALANEKKSGQNLSVITKEGLGIKGELLVVKANKLILMDSSSLTGVEVAIDEVKHIQIVKKSKFLKGLGTGLLIGGLGGAVIGFLSGDDQGFLAMTAGQKALAGALGLGLLGAPIGGIWGMIKGLDESIDLTGKSPEEVKLIMNKLRSYARFGEKFPENIKLSPPAAKKDNLKAPEKEIHVKPSLTVEKEPLQPVQPSKLSRFHLNFIPGYFGSHGKKILQDLLTSVGFGDDEYHSGGWFGSSPRTIEYPEILKNHSPIIKDLRLEYSLNKDFALGISFSLLGNYEVKGRRIVPNKDYRGPLYEAEAHASGFYKGQAFFVTAAYFPIRDVFLKKTTFKFAVGVGMSHVNVDFIGSEFRGGFEDLYYSENLNRKSFSKNAVCFMLLGEYLFFFNKKWSLGLNVDYKYIPVNMDSTQFNSYYSYYDASPHSGGKIHYESIRVNIPSQKWNIGGFGIGVNFGFHF